MHPHRVDDPKVGFYTNREAQVTIQEPDSNWKVSGRFDSYLRRPIIHKFYQEMGQSGVAARLGSERDVSPCEGSNPSFLTTFTIYYMPA
jgi:hypothetical protein